MVIKRRSSGFYIFVRYTGGTLMLGKEDKCLEDYRVNFAEKLNHVRSIEKEIYFSKFKDLKFIFRHLIAIAFKERQFASKH